MKNRSSLTLYVIMLFLHHCTCAVLSVSIFNPIECLHALSIVLEKEPPPSIRSKFNSNRAQSDRLRCLHEGFSVRLSHQYDYKRIIWLHVNVANVTEDRTQNGFGSAIHCHCLKGLGFFGLFCSVLPSHCHLPLQRRDPEVAVLDVSNYHYPLDLPDTSGLNWREAIIQFLESVYPWSRTQPDSEPSQPSPCCTDQLSEPTTDGEPELTGTEEPTQENANEPVIASKPEHNDASDQVGEPATSCITVGVLVEYEGPAHSCNSPLQEFQMFLKRIIFCMFRPVLNRLSSTLNLLTLLHLQSLWTHPAHALRCSLPASLSRLLSLN